MTINSFARYALIGALAVSLGCARNTEDMDDGTATGRTSTADTTAADTSSAGVVGADADSADFHVSPIDSVRTGVVEVDPNRGDTSTTTAGADTAGTDSLRIHRDSANVDPGAGWPSDSTQGGWSTNPADSL
jgi:hypothetical protein